MLSEYSDAIDVRISTAVEKTPTFTAGQVVARSSSSQSYLTDGSDFPGMHFVPVRQHHPSPQGTGQRFCRGSRRLAG